MVKYQMDTPAIIFDEQKVTGWHSLKQGPYQNIEQNKNTKSDKRLLRQLIKKSVLSRRFYKRLSPQ